MEYTQLVGGSCLELGHYYRRNGVPGRLPVFLSARNNPGCLDTLSSFHENVERPILEGQNSDCTKRQLAQGKPSRNDFGISLAASPSRSRVHDWPDGEGLAARLTVQVCCLSLLELSELKDLMKDCEDESTHCFSATQERCSIVNFVERENISECVHA